LKTHSIDVVSVANLSEKKFNDPITSQHIFVLLKFYTEISFSQISFCRFLTCFHENNPKHALNVMNIIITVDVNIILVS